MLFVYLVVAILGLGLAARFFEWAALESRTIPGLHLLGKIALVATGGWLLGMIFYPYYAGSLPLKGVSVFFAALLLIVVFAPRRRTE